MSLHPLTLKVTSRAQISEKALRVSALNYCGDRFTVTDLKTGEHDSPFQLMSISKEPPRQSGPWRTDQLYNQEQDTERLTCLNLS